MPSTIEKLPDEPIVVVTLSEDYDVATEITADLQEHIAFLDSLDEPVCLIMNTSAADFDLTAVIDQAW